MGTGSRATLALKIGSGVRCRLAAGDRWIVAAAAEKWSLLSHRKRVRCLYQSALPWRSPGGTGHLRDAAGHKRPGYGRPARYLRVDRKELGLAIHLGLGLSHDRHDGYAIGAA